MVAWVIWPVHCTYLILTHNTIYPEATLNRLDKTATIAAFNSIRTRPEEVHRTTSITGSW